MINGAPRSYRDMLIATAALFLAAKSKEAPRHLKNILRVSCEILHKQDITLLSYMLLVLIGLLSLRS
ncbi:hypothetical protein Tsubulata_003999 [Turnera subulata]|uniref:Uncharacterized protein n=1 Tax=Turnera subulata TaxID=218843 RepID=A0A9Q0FM41_9ROSI|nr:hypothetical protein Tsubulata_003999 [Turnera subulata]